MTKPIQAMTLAINKGQKQNLLIQNNVYHWLHSSSALESFSGRSLSSVDLPCTRENGEEHTPTNKAQTRTDGAHTKSAREIAS